jgi:hypothetical protein
MARVICPGCGEMYEQETQVAIADFRSLGMDLVIPVETEHFIAPDGTEYCCDDCFMENGK